MYNPSNVYYMITIECNQKCTKCSHWKHKDNADRIQPGKIIDCIKNIQSVNELCLVGGEPLLFKSEIFEILMGVAETGVRTVIITNGVLMDSNFIHVVSNYNIHIVVSIDTMDNVFWKFVRGVNSYDKVFANFEYATKILKPDQISIQSVLSKETRPYMADVAKYAKSKKLHHSIQDYITEGFEGSWVVEEKKQSTNPSNDQQCFAAKRNLSIVQNGDVYTCFQQAWIDGCQMPIGNLNNQKISEIITSEYAEIVCVKMRECNLPCKVLKCNMKN